jgi:predicted RNA binding protein YcfA (HicA-like mRNA interferase family)
VDAQRRGVDRGVRGSSSAFWSSRAGSHDRSHGSHHVYAHPATRWTLSVPVVRRAMSMGTLSRLLKDAEISREELRKLL